MQDERVEQAVDAALAQTFTIAEYEAYLQLLVSKAAVVLCQFQGQKIAASYVRGVSTTLTTQAGVEL